MLRTVMGRLALVVGGFGLVAAALVVVELILGALGAGARRDHDPFVGFANLVPMFEREVEPDGRVVMRTARARATRHRDAFAVPKPADGFRVFVVGGSSAAGVPYGYPFAFAAFLEQKLAAELPDHEVEVVNAAVTGYASRRVLAVVEEIAGYEPDLLIVYAGHNELLERRYYAHLLDLDPRLFRAWRAIAGTRLYAVLTDRFGLDRRTRPADIEFDDLDSLDEMFSVYRIRLSGQDAERAARDRAYTELHYAHNLEAMIDVARSAGAAVALVTTGQNLADWPPGGSRHRADLDAAGLEAFAAALAAGDRAEPSDCAAAVAHWRRALALDDGVAELHFRLARCARRLGEHDTARRHYQRASDLDVIPHGAPSSLNALARQRAEASGALLIDVAAALAERAPQGYVGDADFLDHVHPRLATNVAIAAWIGEALRRAGRPVEADAWRATRWSPPDAEALLASRPDLRAQEHLVRALACALAMRPACVERETRATLALDPENAEARHVAGLMARVERVTAEAAAPSPE